MAQKFVTREKPVSKPKPMVVEQEKPPEPKPVVQKKEVDPKEEAVQTVKRMLQNLMEGADELRLQRPKVLQVRQTILIGVETIRKILKLED